MIGIQEALNKAVEDNRKLEKEIERLEEDNKKLKECLGIVSPSRELQEGKYWENNEIERLKSIIKEVREYLESIETDYAIGCWNKEEDEFIDVKKDILNILDKEN